MYISPLLFASLSSVLAHGVFVAGVGDANLSQMAQAMGVDNKTPRDGTTRQPFQQDSSIIRDREISAGTVDACGRTLAGGPNKMEAAMAAAESSGAVAQVKAQGGQITMTLHQVNGDGAGPYNCEYSADGKTFAQMAITTNVPGQNSRSRAQATDFPLVAKMPPGAKGGMGTNQDMGIVRCRNSARAGPFGGCIPVQIVA